jgi:hypothetical protein
MATTRRRQPRRTHEGLLERSERGCVNQLRRPQPQGQSKRCRRGFGRALVGFCEASESVAPGEGRRKKVDMAKPLC